MNASPPPLIRAMLQADFYPHEVDRVRLRQTHISWVLLTGSFAYKVKKPVNFGFLDFSSLDKRRHFCMEELRLNRRMAPELYLEVLPIGGEAGGFCLGEARDVREYCVKMRQFADADLLVERIRTDSFDAAWMDMLAKDIADFHARSQCDASTTGFGEPRYLQQHIDATVDTAMRQPSIGKSTIGNLHRLSALHIGRLADTFARRMADGFIRDCHGDLHLGNIALFHGRPMVFDCIEFSLEYRAIDTLNDAAFLVMDCDARGHADLAFRFLSRYLESSGDYAGMPLLSLFLSYRAGVRGKVACLLAEDAALGEKDRQGKLDEAAEYFSLAASYLQSPCAPTMYVIGGLSGSGKSHLARLGCGAARAVIIRSDATRKRIAAQYPELPLYGEAMHRHTYRTMFDAADLLLRAGWSVILDATFLSADERQRARDTALAAGAPCHVAWLDIPEDRLREHILHRMHNHTDISDATIQVLDMQLAAYQRPQESDIRFLPSAEHWPWM